MVVLSENLRVEDHISVTLVQQGNPDVSEKLRCSLRGVTH